MIVRLSLMSRRSRLLLCRWRSAPLGHLLPLLPQTCALADAEPVAEHHLHLLEAQARRLGEATRNEDAAEQTEACVEPERA